MPRIPNAVRDQAVSGFRDLICRKMDFVPYPHQREWWAASDGLVLTDEVGAAEDDDVQAVRMPDKSVVYRRVGPRPKGRARVLADLGAFKVGKSKGAGMWAAGFAAVPDGRVSLVGLEYDICEPEFNYIVEALLSSAGMGLKAESLQNRPRDGRMWLELENGCRFEAKSWERKDTLKGKEVDAYVFCEAFMLPGIECYTGVQQNLAARQGYALFPTTPDRPWVMELHERAHGNHPDYYDWHCTCNVPRAQNPETFDQREQDLNDPTKGGLMTQEQFAIAYMGRLGEFIGRCYNYQRGDLIFDASTHPQLWKDPGASCTLANLQIPEGWTVEGAADTGTFMSGTILAFSPDGEAFVIYEQPNYDYVAGKIALDETASIPRWANQMRLAMNVFGVRGLWADLNSQYKHELRFHHDIILLPAKINLQTRTEIAREYVQARRVWLAPWLRILPREMEMAQWPEEATAAGRYERLKVSDHTLDTFEHLLARRPVGRMVNPVKPASFKEQMGWKSRTVGHNPHLGRV